MVQYLVFIGVAISIGSFIPYIRAIIKGLVQPNKITWLLWSIAPMIAFVASVFATGFHLGQITVFVAGFLPMIIFATTFINKNAHWEIRAFDLLCGAASVITLIIWYLTKNPNVAIVLSILSDGMAALPTVIKAYKYPESEVVFPYASGIFSSGISLFTFPKISFANMAFPVYLVVLNIILTIILITKKKNKV